MYTCAMHVQVQCTCTHNGKASVAAVDLFNIDNIFNFILRLAGLCVRVFAEPETVLTSPINK